LGDLNEHYSLGVGVTALADLVVKAMRLPGNKAAEEHLLTVNASEVLEETICQA
jgi:hypothetical protein